VLFVVWIGGIYSIDFFCSSSGVLLEYSLNILKLKFILILLKKKIIIIKKEIYINIIYN